MGSQITTVAATVLPRVPKFTGNHFPTLYYTCSLTHSVSRQRQAPAVSIAK